MFVFPKVGYVIQLEIASPKKWPYEDMGVPGFLWGHLAEVGYVFSKWRVSLTMGEKHSIWNHHPLGSTKQ